MAITFFGYSRTPTSDAGAYNTDPAVIAPPASMATGDLVLLYAYAQASGLTQEISEGGGQSWADGIQCSYIGTSARLFWCRYNGAWTADPSVSSGSVINNTLAMLVFRPSSGANTWEIDVAEAEADFGNPASPDYTVAITGLTIATAGAVAVARWVTYDNNTWGNLTGAGWSKAGLPDQIINLAGTNDSSMTFAYYISTDVGATGDVSQDELTNAPDGGNRDIIAFKEVAGTLTLAVANCAFAHASSTPAPTTSAATLTMSNAAVVLAVAGPTLVAGSWSEDFAGIAQETRYKLEVYDGADWIDLTSISGVNYLKPGTSVKVGGAGVSVDPIAGTWSATIANDDGMFHPNHPTSTYATLLRVGRRVRISLGRMKGGAPVYWQRLIGYMDAPRFSHSSRSVSLSGQDYMKHLTDTTLRHPGNYFGALETFNSVSSSGVTGSEIYNGDDAFAVTADEAATIADGWTTGAVRCSVDSAVDTDGGSSYVASIVRESGTGDAYAHSADIGTVTAGVTYQISFKSKYVVGNQYATMQLFQTIGGALRIVSAKRTLSSATYTETKFTFTPKMTGALECRFAFDRAAVENDEFRVDVLTIKVSAPTWYQYALPETNNNGPYYVTLDGVPCYSGADSEDHTNWHYDEATRYFYFDTLRDVEDGVANLLIYYYTDQTPEGVVARILAKSNLYGAYTTQAELDALTAIALADMDYVPTGITLRRVAFPGDENGYAALDAVRLVCERVNYRFWFDAEGVPCFKPAPVVGEVQYIFQEVDDTADITDYNELGEIKNRVTIEGAKQDIFNVTDQRVSSRVKGEASDATSIAAYLEKACAIDNQLFEDQAACEDMAATILAGAKDPKLYAEIRLFANVVPLAVGETIQWRVVFNSTSPAVGAVFTGIIRSIEFNGSSATYKCEVTTQSATTADTILAVRNAALAHAPSVLSLINIDAATVLTVDSPSVALVAASPAVEAGVNTELYAEGDAMDTLAESDSIDIHWTEHNVFVGSAADAGGGSSFVGIIVRDSAPGDAYLHSSHVADLVTGTSYDLTMDYVVSLAGGLPCTLRLYQVVGSTLTLVSTTPLSSTGWAAKAVTFTSVATGPLQMRLSFPTTGADGDELRIDDISIKKHT